VIPVVFDTSEELRRQAAAGLVVLGEGLAPSDYGTMQQWQCKGK